MGSPPTPVEVECIHCGNVYMSDRIRWRPDSDGPGGGWWVCPIDGCDGAGFCLDIFPTDPKIAEQFGVYSFDTDEEEYDEGDDGEFDSSFDRTPPAYPFPDEDIPF